MATSITSLKRSTRNSMIFWMNTHFYISTTRWARHFVFSTSLCVCFGIGFTCKFIASVSFSPSLGYNCKTEVLSLYYKATLYSWDLGMKLIGPLLVQQPQTMARTAVRCALKCTRVKSPGLFRTLWFRGWDKKLLGVA